MKKLNYVNSTFILTLSSFFVGLLTPILITRKDDYEFIKECIYFPRKQFLDYQQNLKEKGNFNEKYSYNNLKKFLKYFFMGIMRLPTYLFYYKQYRLDYLKKEETRNIKLKEETNAQLNKLKIENESKLEFMKKRLSISTKVDEDEVFQENVLKAKEFVANCLNDHMTTEDKFLYSQPVIMSKSEFLTSTAALFGKSLATEEKMYLIDNLLTDINNKKRFELFNTKYIAIEKKISKLHKFSNMKNLDQILDKEAKINEYKQKNVENRIKKQLFGLDEKKNNVMQVMELFENENNK